MNSGCFLRWRLAATPAEVRNFVATVVSDSQAAGTDGLLGHPGTRTVSLFLYATDADPELVWYVEYEDGAEWDDPAAIARSSSPLFDRGLADLLVDATDPHVVADPTDGVQELVHATLPGRPAEYPTRRTPASSPEDGTRPNVREPNPSGAQSGPAVVAVRLEIRPGIGSQFAQLFGGFVRRTPDWLETRFDAWTEPIMEAEGMYTETLLLERTPDGYVLWWYMEAGDMAQVHDAYYESDQLTARLSEYVLGLVLEHPERVLDHPVEASEFDCIAHAVAADRDGQ